MITIHEHIDHYEKELDAYYAGEKANITRIRKVLAAEGTQPGRVPRLPIAARLGKRGKLPTRPLPGTKTEAVRGLISRPGGASMQELLSITGWQVHTLRAFVSGTLNKKMGLGVRSQKGGKGGRRYLIAA